MRIRPKYLVMLILIACMAAIWFVPPYCLDLLSGGDSVASQHDVDNSGTQVAPPDAQVPTYSRDFVYPVDNTRDPLVQVSIPVVTAQTASLGRKLGITLTGIIWDDETPIAIVADSKSSSHLVRTGEEVDRIKVLAIHSRSITIQNDGRTQKLELWPEKLW